LELFLNRAFCLCRIVWVSFASFANESVCRLHSDTISDCNYLLAIAFVAYCSSDSVCLRCKDRIIWCESFSSMYCLRSLPFIFATRVKQYWRTFRSDIWLSLKLATYKYCIAL